MNTHSKLSTICPTGRKWWIYSRKDNHFDAYGYTKAGGDYEKDANEAMEILSKHLNKAIPTDIELILLGTDQ
jgi:hypothetical protein